MQAALTKANLPLATPSRGDNGKSGDAKTPGTTSANIAQQAYMADVATKVVLPMFKARNKPDATSRPIAPSRLPTRCCARDRACTAASAAATR